MWHTTVMPHNIFSLILKVDLDGSVNIMVEITLALIKGIQNVYALWGTPFMSLFLLRHRSIFRGFVH